MVPSAMMQGGQLLKQALGAALLAMAAAFAGCGSDSDAGGESSAGVLGHQTLFGAVSMGDTALAAEPQNGVFSCPASGCPSLAAEEATLFIQLREDLPAQAEILCRPLRGAWRVYPTQGDHLALPLTEEGFASALGILGPGHRFVLECASAGQGGLLLRSTVSLDMVLRPPQPTGSVDVVSGGGREALLVAPPATALVMAWRLLPQRAMADPADVSWVNVAAGQVAFRIPLPPGHRIVYWWAPASLRCLPAGLRTCAQDLATADMLWISQGELQ